MANRMHSGDEKEPTALLLSDSLHVKREPLCLSYRLTVTVLCTMAMLLCFAEQSSMGSVMVCIVVEEASGLVNDTTTNTPTAANASLGPFKFDWSKEEQGWVHSSLFIGHYLAQVPAGLLATRYGGKRPAVVGVLASSLAQLVTPLAASAGLVWLCATRAVAGLTSGFIYAPVFAVLANWVPREESSILIGLAGTGMELGTVVCFGLSSLFCDSSASGGWPIAFYSIGVIGLVTGVAFAILASDEPWQNKYIQPAERLYIERCVRKAGGQVHVDKNDNSSHSPKIPMLTILTSPPVLAVVVAQMGTDWLYYLTITVLPDFMHETMQFPASTVSLLTGLPFLSIIPAIYALGTLADHLRRRQILSTTAVRKAADFVSKVIPAALLIAMGFLRPGQEVLFVVLYLLLCVFLASCYVAWVTNPLDLAPAYAGFIASVCEVGAMWVAVVVPIFVDRITVDKTPEQWQLVLYVTGALQLGTFIVYLLFGSAKLQPWARPGARKVPVARRESQDGQVMGKHVHPPRELSGTPPARWPPDSPAYASDSEVGRLKMYRPVTFSRRTAKSIYSDVSRRPVSSEDSSNETERTSAYGSFEVTV